MATKSPTQHHNFWGSFTLPANLPNSLGAPVQDAALQPGDTAYEDSTARSWTCTDATLNAAVWAPSSAGGVLVFGANDVAATATDRFLFPTYVELQAPTTVREMSATRDGVLRNLFVRCRIAGTNAGSVITYTVQINGLNSALAVPLDVSILTGSNTADLVSVAAGDRIGVIATKGVINGSPTTIIASMDYL
jgi:hypothetical protein